MSRRKYVAACVLAALAVNVQAESLWELAKANGDVLKISTLFTASQVRDYLGNEKGTADAIDWCRKTGVTHVFIESFRDGYTAERGTLEKARDRFAKEGFEVSGCVTPTGVGKRSTGWNVISCYTDAKTHRRMQEIFE